MEWNWKEVRATPTKQIRLEANFKKDEFTTDKFNKVNIVLNKIENKSIKLRNHYEIIKELDETMMWCEEFTK